MLSPLAQPTGVPPKGKTFSYTAKLLSLKFCKRYGVNAESHALQEVSTFGFRGEALSSLCALASIAVTTRTAHSTPAHRLTFSHTGELLSSVPAARAIGTTVSVKDLFKTLPVRHKVCDYMPCQHLRVVQAVKDKTLLEQSPAPSTHKLLVVASVADMQPKV